MQASAGALKREHARGLTPFRKAVAVLALLRPAVLCGQAQILEVHAAPREPGRPERLGGSVERPAERRLDLIARAVDVPATVATHVRLRVLSKQCTGGPAYQGDQDADPVSDSDCVAGSASAARRVPQGGNVRAAELQVFSSSP